MADREREVAPDFARTVGSEIQRVFPGGLVYDVDKDEFLADWSEPPLFPADLFAVAGHLLEASGAYQYIVAPFGATGSVVEYGGPTKAPSQRTIERWAKIGRRWATDWDAVDEEITPIWKRLVRHWDAKLVATPRTKTPPAWWGIAHSLLVIADEASGGLGYQFAEDPANPVALDWANYVTAQQLNAETKRWQIDPATSVSRIGGHVGRHVALDSVAQLASREVVRVLPKGRTASLGCTFRTLTHNLALMPAHGRSNSYWHQPRTVADMSAKKGEDLNLLLIPFPYRIPEGCFVGEQCGVSNGDGPWGRFRVDQKWLQPLHISGAQARRSFIEFVDALITQTEADGHPVHGLVLPELALDWETYDALARRLLVDRPAIELLMSGVSQDCNGQYGNLVTTSLFHAVDGEPFVETHSRMKHHRWRLDDAQIKNYGLERELNPDALWWEYLEVGERVLNIDVLRQSTITAVICEDLARVDPGLAALRLLGPNIVIALLMDGPQVKRRWPGIYAGALAEDPGSSVLTLTSLGLVTRSNAQYKGDPKDVIAFWRDYPQRGATSDPHHELILPADKHGILLRLKPEKAMEATIDGRPNSDAIAWIYRDHTAVGLTTPQLKKRDWQWIVQR